MEAKPSPSPLANVLRHATKDFSQGLCGGEDRELIPPADEWPSTFQKGAEAMDGGLHCALSNDDLLRKCSRGERFRTGRKTQLGSPFCGV